MKSLPMRFINHSVLPVSIAIQRMPGNRQPLSMTVISHSIKITERNASHATRNIITRPIHATDAMNIPLQISGKNTWKKGSAIMNDAHNAIEAAINIRQNRAAMIDANMIRKMIK